MTEATLVLVCQRPAPGIGKQRHMQETILKNGQDDMQDNVHQYYGETLTQSGQKPINMRLANGHLFVNYLVPFCVSAYSGAKVIATTKSISRKITAQTRSYNHADFVRDEILNAGFMQS